MNWTTLYSTRASLDLSNQEVSLRHVRMLTRISTDEARLFHLWTESIEDAVRREVMEEAGVKVGQVR
jgi:8-oxo-dGTP pyrophosphatase MutT (NUDIX family)